MIRLGQLYGQEIKPSTGGVDLDIGGALVEIKYVYTERNWLHIRRGRLLYQRIFLWFKQWIFGPGSS